MVEGLNRIDPLRLVDAWPEAQGGGEDVELSDEPTLMIENPDGSVIVDFGPKGRDDEGDESDFFANLAGQIGDDELGRIAEELLRGVESDEMSRHEWLETRAEGIRLLGWQLKAPEGSVDNTSSLEGISRVDHPLLSEAVLRFQANARGELLPSDGPVKVRDDKYETASDNSTAAPAQSRGALGDGAAASTVHMGEGDITGGYPQSAAASTHPRDNLAEALERDLNHYLTAVAKEYYPDTDRMLLYVGFGGCGIKKVYRCPLRRRPVSESVDVKDFIVSNAATDLASSGRFTQRVMMRRSMLRRMQIVGAYRDVSLASDPNPTPNEVDREIAETQGVSPIAQLPEDRDYTIYEVYAELDIPGFEHKVDGEPSGLAVPYVVTIEKDSRQVLAIRRNYDENDELCTVKVPFVKYPFVPGLGFYDVGLVHLLGNTTRALTAMWRIGIDAGMFANFPGFLYLSSALKKRDNHFRVPPGGGAPVESSAMDIRQAVMPLPYHETGPGFSALMADVAQTGQRVGGTAEVMVGEGRQDAPVGTTIALIEQATKVLDAVHKRLHTAQAEEFALLRDLFREDPSALIAHKRSELKAMGASDEVVIQALNDYELVPMADPNTPSHMHRVMKATAIKQLQAANPALYDAKKVDERILEMIGVNDPEELFAPPQAPQGPPLPSPDKSLEAQARLQQTTMQTQQRAASDALRYADSAKDRESKEKLAVMDLAKTLAIHPESESLTQQFINHPPGGGGA